MSEHFSPIPFRQLLSYILGSFDKNRSILGIYKSQFYQPCKSEHLQGSIFGQPLGTPIGVAAGPHTQLAQNIVCAWLCGARYIELKTVQTLDHISVSKPCIDMQDEGYNCEWSQELKIKESFVEYLKAWLIIKILSHKFGWNNSNAIFNMSVGYDMAGILQDNVQWFLKKMSNCAEEKSKLIDEVVDIYPEIKAIEIPDRVSNNITLSTMHGCPSEEIEEIGRYLIEEKRLHTFIKFNPTLLGKEGTHKILNEKLGYSACVPDEAFEHDIKYSEALRVIRSLQKSAKQNQRFFGVKLTNTLEVINHKGVFRDKRMYLSGKALHPISINVALKLKNDVPNLPVSFCGGVNAFNIADVLSCGLYPVTVCSDLLKPGGYARLTQYIEEIEKALEDCQRENLHEYVQGKSLQEDFLQGAICNLKEYARRTLSDPAYKPHSRDIKTDRELTEFDCIQAPCELTCPTHQNVSEYMYWTEQEDLHRAFTSIMRTNPFPTVTGMVCDHPCQTKCTRSHYDQPLMIREIKRYIAENVSYEKVNPPHNNGKRVAIIGAGPSGLSCAYYLRMAGFEVEVYEAQEFSGGMLKKVIPCFRLSEDALYRDIDHIQKLGVKINTSCRVDKAMFESIKREFDFVYIAVGAQESKKIHIQDDRADGILDPLEFLASVKKGTNITLGGHIVVLGGGNTAIDSARAANFLVQENGKVRIVYRRTRSEMPAGEEEVESALEEGIELIELAAPVRILSKNGKVKTLVCKRMRLEGIDQSGRPKPTPIEGSEFEIPADIIIPAFGQESNIDFVETEKLKQVDSITRELGLTNVFIGGDAYRGASSVIQAIADGKKTAETIIKRGDPDLPNPESKYTKSSLSHESLYQKKARLKRSIKLPDLQKEKRNYSDLVIRTLTKEDAKKEASRCLFCDELCDICVTVCPNRANVSYYVKPAEIMLQKAINKNGNIKIVNDQLFRITQKYQILNIDNFCNECGNCTTFCPTNGEPYLTKPKLFLTFDSFQDASNGYFFKSNTLFYKDQDAMQSLTLDRDNYIFESKDYDVKLDTKTLRILDVRFKNSLVREASQEQAVKMYVIFNGAKNILKNIKL